MSAVVEGFVGKVVTAVLKLEEAVPAFVVTAQGCNYIEVAHQVVKVVSGRLDPVVAEIARPGEVVFEEFKIQGGGSAYLVPSFVILHHKDEFVVLTQGRAHNGIGHITVLHIEREPDSVLVV